MSEELSLKQIKKEWQGSIKSYVIGFLTSLILTLISFGLVAGKIFSSRTLLFVLGGLALVQAVLQLIFFLHAGQEAKPRWESLILYFMVLVLLIIVVGTLWVMDDLDQRVMSHMNMEMPHD